MRKATKSSAALNVPKITVAPSQTKQSGRRALVREVTKNSMVTLQTRMAENSPIQVCKDSRL